MYVKFHGKKKLVYATMGAIKECQGKPRMHAVLSC